MRARLSIIRAARRKRPRCVRDLRQAGKAEEPPAGGPASEVADRPRAAEEVIPILEGWIRVIQKKAASTRIP